MTCFRMKNGESMNSYCKKHKISYVMAVYYIEKGMDVEQAVKTAKEREGGKWRLKYKDENGRSLLSQMSWNEYYRARTRILRGDLTRGNK